MGGWQNRMKEAARRGVLYLLMYLACRPSRFYAPLHAELEPLTSAPVGVLTRSPPPPPPPHLRTAMDDSLAPIALLIDSLRSQDPSQRLTSVKKLAVISKALGKAPRSPAATTATNTGVDHAPARRPLPAAARPPPPPPTHTPALPASRRGAHAQGADPFCQ